MRLLKYLKPYAWSVVLAVLLLFIQANADLALPDYLSRIVNNGIQQGGLVNAVPEAVRKTTMDRLTLFMSAGEKAGVLASYTLVEPGSAQAGTLVEKYPALESEAVYTINKVDEIEIERLNPILAKSFLAVSFIEQLSSNPSAAAEMISSLGFDPAQIPPGTDFFSVLPLLPEQARTQMMAAINQKTAELSEKILTQSAVSAVSAEYENLGIDTADVQTRYILNTGLLMLAISLVSVACAVTVGFLSARTAGGLARDLRSGVFQKVESFSNTEFDKFSTASLITRSTNDITQIQMLVIMMMRMVFYAPIMGIGGIIRAVNKDSSMWWIIAVAVMVVLGLVAVIFSITLPKFKLVQKLTDRLNLVSRENLSGMMVIRAFNMQNFEETRFDHANKDLTGVLLFINRVMTIMFPTMMMIMNVVSISIIWIGAHQVAQSSMQVGDMMAFMQYAMQIMFSFLMLSLLFIILPRALVSVDRIAEVLDTEPAIQDPPSPKPFQEPFKGMIEFRDVSFRYPGGLEDAIQNVSFLAQPGQTTAFIGATGSGKSTIVNLIPRFYEVTSGSILIDGVDIRDVTQHNLRQKIGFVPQKSNLFAGTIESNLRYADEEAPAEELALAAKVSQAQEFIDASSDGLNTEIAQGGMNVSGGQKQRLSIARALVKKAPINIFDDSFSALDFRTDAALRRSLKENAGQSTLLIVTQRVSTIKNADQIVVLDEGHVVGKGTHSELMQSCETYREIALSQLSQEELV